MSAWCSNTFVKNGILREIEQSILTSDEAQKKLIKFLREHSTAGSCVLAGNSVSIMIRLKDTSPPPPPCV